MPILKALRPLFNFHREICIVTAELRINAVAVWHAPYMCLSCVHSSVYTCLNRHCQCQLYSCFLLPDSKNTYIKHLHFVGSGSLFLHKKRVGSQSTQFVLLLPSHFRQATCKCSRRLHLLRQKL